MLVRIHIVHSNVAIAHLSSASVRQASHESPTDLMLALTLVLSSYHASADLEDAVPPTLSAPGAVRNGEGAGESASEAEGLGAPEEDAEAVRSEAARAAAAVAEPRTGIVSDAEGATSEAAAAQARHEAQLQLQEARHEEELREARQLRWQRWKSTFGKRIDWRYTLDQATACLLVRITL